MNFEQHSENSEKKGMTRRELLKRAGVGAAVLGLAASGAYIEHNEQSKVEEEKLNEEGTVTKKKYLPRRKGALPGVRVSSTIELPERWDIHIQTSRGPTEISVSKEEFDAYAEGEKVAVKFRRHPLPGVADINKVGFGIESIKKIN
ncbi:MAG: twin-arginine translocation signal domain-containing protein [Candidatus Moranbacteria bacterium]|nr:twin-arginine translocation signal domain-containing protein [Candidatus Moranbacteria bacterium]